MYWVVSKWRVNPGKEGEWTDTGRKVREAMRQIPGIQIAEAFRNEAGEVVALVGYTSEADYDRIVRDPAGPFEQTISQHRLEEAATWVSSERGDSLD